MANREVHSIVEDYLLNRIIEEITESGASETLEEVLAEYCSKDDIIDIFPEAFEEK
jgi:hypothetical protein